MPSAKIAISIDPADLEELDALVSRGIAASRSKLIQDAVREKLSRLKRVSLAAECARLDPAEEQAAAESFLVAETPRPEY